MEYEKTSYSTVGGRLKQRGSYDKATVHAIVNTALLVNVAFIDDEGLPQVIPMNGMVVDEATDEAAYVLLHGYQNGRFIKQCSEPNMRLCVSATHVDGHVLGLSAQAHSLNYRSAVLHGYVDERVEKKDVKTKRELARLVTNHIIPERWSEVRQPTDVDLVEVGFIKMRIETASAKIRNAGPGDFQSDIDKPQYRDNVWAGVIPLRQLHGEPQPADYNKATHPPEYWGSRYRERGS